jgi:geranylgeranyl diphosphate synthase type II
MSIHSSSPQPQPQPQPASSSPTPLAFDPVTFKQSLDHELNQLFDTAIAHARVIDLVYAELLEATRDTLLAGGKRLRPYLAYVAYVGLGGADPQAFTSAATSQELLHHFLLIHDDIIDRDLRRHGGPNVEGIYHDRFMRQGLAPAQALHQAESFALMAGDAACALGLQVITDAKFNASVKLAALRSVHRMLFEVMGGQLMDIDSAISDRPPTPERLLSVCHYKTATYSFQTPLQFGAILAGAPAAIQDQLRHFGYELGIAYQLTDDLLGVFGDEAKLGKSVTSDLHEGKQTLLIYHAFQLTTPAQAKTLRQLWGNPDATATDLTTVRQLLHDTGAQAKVASLADVHFQAALAALARINILPPAKVELERLARFCVNRQH